MEWKSSTKYTFTRLHFYYEEIFNINKLEQRLDLFTFVVLAAWFLSGAMKWSTSTLVTRAFTSAFIWQPWFPSLRISIIPLRCEHYTITADLSSREPGLPPHWSPEPPSNLIGRTILSRPWVRSFGVGYSAVGPSKLSTWQFRGFSPTSQTVPQPSRAPREDKVPSQWSSFMLVNS